jgi:hypothetical protein
MPATLQRRVKKAFPISLVFLTIALVLTAPRARPARITIASSRRDSSLASSSVGLLSFERTLDAQRLEDRARATAASQRAARERRAHRRARRHVRKAAATPPVVARPAPTPPRPPGSPQVNWFAIAQCESGQRWSYNGSSGFDGGLQFLPSTWSALHTGYAYAWQAPASVQIATAQRLLAEVGGRGWTQWPVCWWRQ